MTMHDDLFATINEIIDNDIHDDDIRKVRAVLDGMNPTEQMLFEVGQFFMREAVVHDEGRLFHAGYACLLVSGVLNPIIGEIPGPTALMDFADTAWAEAKQIVTQAIDQMLWGAR